MDNVERVAREIFDETVNKDDWNLTWDAAPPHYREVCMMQARARIDGLGKGRSI